MKKGFGRRLMLYLVGVVLGSILIYPLFMNRSCNWLPGDRVKLTIFRKLIVVPDDQKVALNELGIDKSTVGTYLSQEDIDFSESLKDLGVYPKVYVFKKNEKYPKRVQLSFYEDSYIAVLHVLEDDETPQRYENLQGFGEIYRIPADSALVKIDNSNYIQCKARGLTTTDYKQIIQDIKNTGRIDFSKSDLMLTKAEQQLLFTQNDTLQVEAKTIWFKERINFKDFYWDEKLPCEEN